MYMSLSNQAIKIAYDAGYRIVKGKILSPRKKELQGSIGAWGYRVFSIRLPVSFVPGIRKTKQIKAHRLLAYQKFGDEIFKPDIVVRHKDGNPLNNLDDNILIGSQSENMMDKPIAARIISSMNASQKNRILTDEEVAQLKTDRFVHGLTYQQLADKYEIGNKGHAHYVANHQYVTKK